MNIRGAIGEISLQDFELRHRRGTHHRRRLVGAIVDAAMAFDPANRPRRVAAGFSVPRHVFTALTTNSRHAAEVSQQQRARHEKACHRLVELPFAGCYDDEHTDNAHAISGDNGP
jgi:hypothetical protein